MKAIDDAYFSLTSDFVDFACKHCNLQGVPATLGTLKIQVLYFLSSFLCFSCCDWSELYDFDRSITKAISSHNVKENEQKVANIKTVIAHDTNQFFDELGYDLPDKTTS